MLWRMFRPEREKVRGGCRKMYNEGLHKLFSSMHIPKEIN
jgi:hypothetical protein